MLTHALFATLVLVLAVMAFMRGPEAVPPGEYVPRPDPLFDSLDAWIRGLLAICGVGAAALLIVGMVLWVRTGRRAFGVAMDIAVGVAMLGVTSTHDSPAAIGIAVLAPMAAFALLFAPSMTRPTTPSGAIRVTD